MINIYSTLMLLYKFNDSAQRLRYFRKECSFSFLELWGGSKKRKKKREKKNNKHIVCAHIFSSKLNSEHNASTKWWEKKYSIFLFTNLLTHCYILFFSFSHCLSLTSLFHFDFHLMC